MKGKRIKRAQKSMHAIYERSFGMRTPYQLILDGEFLKTALAQKLYFKEALPNLLGGPVRLFTTGCVLKELQKENSPAVFNARRLEQRRCTHEAGTSGKDCILEIIGPDNKHHYGVCAQQDDLREELREVPGVPLVLLNRGVLVMEEPSKQTLEKAEKINKSKQAIDEEELKTIAKIVPVPEPLKEVKRKKKMRGVNPLSCKKPTTDAKKKRKRPEKRTRR